MFGRYGTEDVSVEYARKRSATTRVIFQSTLTQCRQIIALSRSTPSKSSAARAGTASPSGSAPGTPSRPREPVPNPFLSPGDRAGKQAKAPPLSPFGRSKLDLSGLRRNAPTEVTVKTTPKAIPQPPLAVPSPFLHDHLPKSSTSPFVTSKPESKPEPTTPKKARGSQEPPSPTVAASPSRRGNASPMHNSLLKAKAEAVRASVRKAQSQRIPATIEEDEEDELGLRDRSTVEDSPSKRRKFKGKGVDLESAIKENPTFDAKEAEASGSCSPTRQTKPGMKARLPSPPRHFVDPIAIHLPIQTPFSLTASPYLSPHHPPLTYTGLSNYVLPSLRDRIFAKTTPSAESAWGPAFVMNCQGGHGYKEAEDADDADDVAARRRTLEAAAKKRARAEKRRRRLMRSLQKGLAVEDDLAQGNEDQEMHEARDESDRLATRTRTQRWESDFGLSARDHEGNGEEASGSSWHNALRRVSFRATAGYPGYLSLGEPS